MVMAISSSICRSGSTPLCTPVRSTNSLSGRGLSSFVSFSNESVKGWQRYGLQLGEGRMSGSTSRAVSLLNGGGAVEGESLKSKSRSGSDRRFGVAAPASSASASSSLSSTEKPGLEHGGGGNGVIGGGGGSGGGGGGGDSGFGGADSGGSGGGILGVLIRGWKARVKADPDFAFKVLMEEVIGVGACVLGDMATRPNFGLDELDLVFSTLVVGCILNFTLMYMLAPTAAAGAVASKLPGIFAGCPPGHMFEIGSYSLLNRAGTFVYKGSQFAVVGLFAGLVGTGLSNLLINARKKLDPTFVSQNATPPILLNAGTWAIHMGVSSNGRYQSLNGIEFGLAKVLSPGAFKLFVTVLRGLNNVLGGMSFVYLARLTGSQSGDPPVPPNDPVLDMKSLEAEIASTGT